MPRGALSVYRVLDLADQTGLLGTKMMADLGADVLKIEPPTGCSSRRLPPFYPNVSGSEASLYFP